MLRTRLLCNWRRVACSRPANTQRVSLSVIDITRLRTNLVATVPLIKRYFTIRFTTLGGNFGYDNDDPIGWRSESVKNEDDLFLYILYNVIEPRMPSMR